MISSYDANSVAILGSAYSDTVVNAGSITGRVLLGEGNDSYMQRGAISSSLRVDLGGGDDIYRHETTGTTWLIHFG